MAEVLIVDDDHNFRETLRELLTDAGYLRCSSMWRIARATVVELLRQQRFRDRSLEDI